MILGLSRRTIVSLRQEMSQLAIQQAILKQKEPENEPIARPQRQSTWFTTKSEDNQPLPDNIGRKGRRRCTTPSITTIVNTPGIPSPMSPKKQGNSGRKKIHLTEYEDMIRYQFHLLLASKQYPTTAKLLTRLLDDTPNFPIQSGTIFPWTYASNWF